jgi:hypothetical protein
MLPRRGTDEEQPYQDCSRFFFVNAVYIGRPSTTKFLTHLGYISAGEKKTVETPFGVVTEIVYFIISDKNHQEFEINTYNGDLAVFGMHVGWGKKARIFEARPSSPDSGRFTEKKVGARRRTPERCIILC